MDKIKRSKTKVIRIGNIRIGGDNPIAIQSMTKTHTYDIPGTIKQIRELESAGCQIVRLAVKDSKDAKALKKIKVAARIPVVADIHFDWRLALEAIENGVDKIRLNPGNINDREQVRAIVKAAKTSHIPIRVGLNSGSLPAAVAGISRSKGLPQAMVKAALDYIRVMEKAGFYDIVVSLKGSDIFDTIDVYRRMAKVCDYPLHLGVTASGLPRSGVVKSAIALSVLLFEGIGDTIRVSLTEDPVAEVEAARSILEALGLSRYGPEIISCPTCGRCEVDLISVVRDLEEKLSAKRHQPAARPLKIAVMGCVVNGPGEARGADIGIAFGKKEGLLFRRGKAVRKVALNKCVNILLKEAVR
ncbi:MAG: flavodoxin-dependent (E)-4-hydroxy-3-methylbut-2-enyl-diphosphate synthase [Candidatus Omnitrophota bacterium]|jgi:(E)-4-hydroxy-3-methylbut-2-enyl-diphosphate synthase